MSTTNTGNDNSPSGEYSSRATVRLVGFDPDLPSGFLRLDRVLFLDFDGVLHPDDADLDQVFCFLPDFCEVLRSVDPAGEIPIVITSMWRFDSTLAQLRSHFPVDVARQIVGVTADLMDRSEDSGAWAPAGGASKTGSRQREVLHWMRRYAPAGQWLAIDDRSSYFALDCPNLFVVPGQHADEGGGITAAVAPSLRQRLQDFLVCVQDQASREHALLRP